MSVLETRAYAKLNLSLDVLDRRSDGYHEMRMVMQTVTLSDALRLETGTGKPLSMRSSLGFLPPTSATWRRPPPCACARRRGRTAAGCPLSWTSPSRCAPGWRGAAPTPLPSCGGSTACWGWASRRSGWRPSGPGWAPTCPTASGAAPPWPRGGGRCSPLCPPCPTAMWCCASPPSRCPRRSSSPGWTAAASAAARTPPVCWPPWRRGIWLEWPAHV